MSIRLREFPLSPVSFSGCDCIPELFIWALTVSSEKRTNVFVVPLPFFAYDLVPGIGKSGVVLYHIVVKILQGLAFDIILEL